MSRGSSKSKKHRRLLASSKSTSVTAQGKPFGYRWVALDPDQPNKPSLIPGIPVVLHGPKGRIPTTGLIDSGADTLLMPLALAKALGIDKDKCEERECLS